MKILNATGGLLFKKLFTRHYSPSTSIRKLNCKLGGLTKTDQILFFQNNRKKV